MSDEAKTKEQERLIRSNARKVLDALVKIAPVSKGAKEAYSLSRETEKALTMSARTMESGRLTASDENMNLLSQIARSISSDLSTLNRHDMNWWLENSGANLFSKSDSTEALKRLEQQRQHLIGMKEGCDGLKTLAALMFTQSVANVKGIAKLWVPSIPMIDGVVTKETRETLDVCMRLSDSIVGKLDQAIRATADMNKFIDRFLALVNTRDQRATVNGMQQAAGKTAPVPARR
jgi:hypothetical protein